MSEVTQTPAQATPEAVAGASGQTPTPAESPKAQETVVKAAEPAKAAAPEAKATIVTEPPKAEAGQEKTPEAKKEEITPPSEQKPAVPEKYDLKLPKDSALSAAHVEKLSAYAKEKGYSNEHAQALLERESQAVSDYASSVKEAQSKLASSWVEQAQNDKEIGGQAFKENVEQAKRVVQRFGTDDFKKELNKTGLGNHPELLRVFARIGKAMADDKFVHAGAQGGGSKKSHEAILYGPSDNKES